MSLAQDFQQDSAHLWGALKSFSLWSFTLSVCLLVAGFPLVAIVGTVGLFLAMTLHAVVPASAVLLVAGRTDAQGHPSATRVVAALAQWQSGRAASQPVRYLPSGL